MDVVDAVDFAKTRSGLAAWFRPGWRDGASLFTAEEAEAPRVERRVGHHRLVLLNDAADAHHVLSRGEAQYRLSNIEKRLIGPIVGAGLTVAEGPSWAVQRALAGEVVAASRDRLDARFDLWLDAEVERFGLELAARPERLLALLEDLTLQALAQTMFMVHPAMDRQALLAAIDLVRQTMGRFDLADALGLPPSLPTPKTARLRALARVFDREIFAHISGSEALTWSRLGSKPEQRRDFAVAMLTSFEATSLSLFWCLAIAQNQARDAAMRADRERLQRVLRETLRLYPPFPLLLRVARRRDEGVQPAIAAGALVCISPYFLHRRAAYWSEPSRFKPERFSGSNSPRAYLPFGAGPRVCSGARLAMPLLEKLLAALVRRWEVRIAPESDLTPQLGVTLRPRGPIVAQLAARAP